MEKCQPGKTMRDAIKEERKRTGKGMPWSTEWMKNRTEGFDNMSRRAEERNREELGKKGHEIVHINVPGSSVKRGRSQRLKTCRRCRVSVEELKDRGGRCEGYEFDAAGNRRRWRPNLETWEKMVGLGLEGRLRDTWNIGEEEVKARKDMRETLRKIETGELKVKRVRKKVAKKKSIKGVRSNKGKGGKN